MILKIEIYNNKWTFLHTLQNLLIIYQKNKINNDPIFLFTQFFINPNKERDRENKECLKDNAQNASLTESSIG